SESPGFRLERHLPYVLGALGLLTLGAMLFIFLRAIKGPTPTAAPVLSAAEATPALGGVATASVVGSPEAALAAPPDPALLEERRALAIEFANKDPAGAALILSHWLGAGDDVKSAVTSEGA